MEERSTSARLAVGAARRRVRKSQVLVCGQELEDPGDPAGSSRSGLRPELRRSLPESVPRRSEGTWSCPRHLSNEGDRLPGTDIKGLQMRRMSRQEYVNTVDANRNSPVASKEPHAA